MINKICNDCFKKWGRWELTPPPSMLINTPCALCGKPIGRDNHTVDNDELERIKNQVEE